MSGNGAVMAGRGAGTGTSAARTGRPGLEAAQRRMVVLAAALAVPTALMTAGLWQAWALYAVPVALAVPLGGGRGLTTAGSVAALAMALASGRPDADGLTLALAFAGFLAAGLGIGAIHEGRARGGAGHPAADRRTGLLPAPWLPGALARECRRARRYGQPLTLALMEPDDLEGLTRRHGPRAADRLLAMVGKAVGASARGSDLAARGRGAQVALLVPGPVEEAAAAVGRIRARVAAQVVVPISLGAVTVSAGLAPYAPREDEDGSAMLARAEAALRVAAETGGDRVEVAPAPGPARLSA